jgi:hypothetical protein
MSNTFCDAVRITCVAGVAGVEVGASKPATLAQRFRAGTRLHTHTHTQGMFRTGGNGAQIPNTTVRA